MSVNFRPADDAATFRFGEFTFDCGSRLLTCNEVKRHLSPKAQLLLELLIQARPRALSREELYDALWPSTFVCETNLASIISEVRRALGDEARASQYIRTIHGFGYAFCGEVVSSVATKSAVAMLLCGEGNHLLYEGENLIGRADGCSVVIAARTISRRHALITIYDGAFSIRDLDSTNGTYVDGQRIGSFPVMVLEGSRIALGTVRASIIARNAPSSTVPVECVMMDAPL
jgi:DNA-binding winged helix-turn-helix (wHTH) protein